MNYNERLFNFSKNCTDAQELEEKTENDFLEQILKRCQKILDEYYMDPKLREDFTNEYFIIKVEDYDHQRPIKNSEDSKFIQFYDFISNLICLGKFAEFDDKYGITIIKKTTEDEHNKEYVLKWDYKRYFEELNKSELDEKVKTLKK